MNPVLDRTIRFLESYQLLTFGGALLLLLAIGNGLGLITSPHATLPMWTYGLFGGFCVCLALYLILASDRDHDYRTE